MGFWDFWIFAFLDFWIFGFLDFWIFGFLDFGFLDFGILGFWDFRSRCLITVMDKWAKCAFLRVVAGGGEHIYIYMYTSWA